jgi:hypothetical protein
MKPPFTTAKDDNTQILCIKNVKATHSSFTEAGQGCRMGIIRTQ